MSTRSLALATLVLVVTAGCASGPGTPSGAPATPSAAQSVGPSKDVARRIDDAKADCLKAKGFKYVPWSPPMPPMTEEQKKQAAGDYEALKAQRAKEGFGIAAAVMNARGDLGGGAEPPRNPNIAIIKDLSPAQRKAYSVASGECGVKAIKQITGEDVRSYQEWEEQRHVAMLERENREIDGDPQLVTLASAMADCMTAKGYRFTSTKPSDVVSWGSDLFSREMHKIAQKEDKSIPDVRNGGMYLPKHMTMGEKRAFLQREVKVALDDLECGRDFYPAFATVGERVRGESES
ncbi:hypothetical protein HII36_20030 [Nonomuraea sp. NN258]|uniref:hypothetical protein n=1 Tax=Nonomuraea antri TaxID=2730852 RepID=UPI001568A483|nr:hypothetical protein [Nonomuraea antri]NRQ34124.1 hypothetical protein [Nonomuraea antri]